MNKIGIVGGAGFIGLALAGHLSKSFRVKNFGKTSNTEGLLARKLVKEKLKAKQHI